MDYDGLKLFQDSLTGDQRTVYVSSTDKNAALIVSCGKNDDIDLTFTSAYQPNLGRPIARIRIIDSNNNETVFGADPFMPSENTIVLAATPNNMRAVPRRPSKILKFISSLERFQLVLDFSKSSIVANFEDHVAQLSVLYIASLCYFDILAE